MSDESENAELARLVEAGLTREQIGSALGISARTVTRRIARIRHEAARAPDPGKGLKERVIATLTRTMEADNSVPAAKALLDEIAREQSTAEYADRTAAVARAWARETAARLGAWARPQLEDDPTLRDLWRKCGSTAVNPADRERLVAKLLDMGAMEAIRGL